MQAPILSRWFRMFVFTLVGLGLQQAAFGQSVVLNPGFESGTSPWIFYSDGSATFTTTAAGSGSTAAARVVTNTQGSNVQLYQAGITLEANTQYILSFKAYSNTGHDVAVVVGKHTAPFTSYGLPNQAFDLTTSWNTYSIQFTTSGYSGTVTDARLRFWLAPYDANGDQYFFDDVILNKTGTSAEAPVITQHPSNQTVTAGQTATLTVAASGTAPLTYQWQKNNVGIGGATSPSYTTPATVLGDNGSTYRCIVTNSVNSATSNQATLTVNNAQPTTGLVSDDFSAPTLNTSLWTFVNPRGDATASVTGTGTPDARLSITVPAGVSHDIWSDGNNAPRLLQSFNNGDFEATVKFESPLTAQYQMEGILAQQDNSTFIRFDFVRDATRTRFFCATFNAGTPVVRKDTALAPSTQLYLRVKRQGNAWTGSLSYDGSTWVTAVSFSQALTVNSVGPFVGNHGVPASSSPAYTGLVDYFFNTASPISPEDPTGSPVAPSITQHPSNQTVTVGQTATFTVAASGTAPLTYQWQKNNVNIGGATSPSYTTPSTVLGDNGSTYRCIVTNSVNSATSNAATLTVGGGTIPNVLANGSFELGTAGWILYTNGGGAFTTAAPGTDGSSAARVSITAAGSNVQLYQSGFTLEPGTKYVLTFDAYANVSRTIAVSVQKHVAPYTTYGLNAQLFTLGTSWQTFTVTFTTSGFSSPVTDARLMLWLANQDVAGDQYFFDNIVLGKEGAGAPTPPSITSQPSNRTVTVGQTAAFTVVAAGTTPLTFQWQKNGVNIGGAASPSYTTPAAVIGDNGSTYRCIVTNSVNSATSNAATLTVQTGSTASSLSFAHHIIDSNPPRSPHDKAVGDINGDGFIDVLAASSSNFTEGLFWYKYPSWAKYNIHTGSFTTSMQVADIDGDGDLDAILGKGEYYGNTIWVYVNPRPSGNPEIGSSWQEVYVGDATAHDYEVGDMNNDGKLDIVVRGGTVAIFLQNTLTSWTKVPLPTRQFEGTSLADIDGDGDLDIVINGYWLRNPLPGGNPASAPWTEHLVSANWLDHLRVHVADINGDGRQDIMFAPSEYAGGILAWYESTSPLTGPWTEHVMATNVGYIHTLETADMDGDGDLDVVTAEMHQSVDPDEVVVYRNSGNGLSWDTVIVARTGSHNARLGDIGNDGRIDIVGANWNISAPGGTPIEYWENLEGGISLNQWTYIQADVSRGPSMTGKGTFGLGFADLNGDGYQDVASGHYFYRNPGGAMTTVPWPRTTLPNNPLNGRPLDASLLFDVEGTGVKNDIIAQDLPSVLWLKANDAQGNSWTPTVIAQIPITAEGNGRTVKSAHIISANTKPDILLSGGDGVYLMQIPANPAAGNWPIMKITTSSNGEQKAIGIGDINRDGTLDIAVAKGAVQLEVDWWSNPGDGTNTWVKYVIGNTNAEVKMIEVADVNGDGRLDVIVTEEARPASLYWFEAPADPANGTWIRHTVATGLEELDSMSGIDMNNDGKPDIIVGEIFGLQRVIIYENQYNGASWGVHVVDSGKESHNGVRAVDLNFDGGLDIVSIAYNSYAYLHVWRNDAPASGQASGNPALPVLDIASPPSQTPLPTVFSLRQNYPNPFNPATTIHYAIPQGTHVRLTIFDMLGRELIRLVDDAREAGEYEVRWDATAQASGMYLCRIETKEYSAAIKLLLVR